MEPADWRYMVFMVFLALASWQDLWKMSVGLWLYFGFGAAAAAMRLAEGGCRLSDVSGLAVGLALLAAGRLAGGAIGSGDGWFFVVSGLYLDLYENISLLFYGVLLGGLFCLLLLIYGKTKGRSMRRKSIPFLPFLIPAWIWMVMS